MTVRVIYTIGVYGYAAEKFIAAITEHEIDLFCDLRARRGLRGSAYAYANSVRLQQLLADAGVRYRHYRELAPGTEIRATQHAADRAVGIGKRSRHALSSDFVRAYSMLIAGPAQQHALREIGESSERPCLFCVEREPEACHRSVAAAELAEWTGRRVVNLRP